ncbi:MAG: hypothetical protein ACRD2T_00165 [Thermoanaerobaculia bacterium]
MQTRRPSIQSPAAATLAATLLLTACFDPPVSELLELRFLPHGEFVVASRVEIREPEKTGNRALERRLAEVRRALAQEDDDWSRRFAVLDPAAERFAWEKHLGAIHRVEREAALAEPAQLASFFADTALAVSYEVRDGLGELSIVPGPAGRASRRQRREVEVALTMWSGRIAAYLEAAEALYAYLDEHPERARAALGTLLSDLLSDADRAALEALDREEQALVEAVEEAMEEVVAVLLVAPGEERSLDELSRLVYDPFPALLRVRLPQPPQEVEGFAREGEVELLAGGLGLWPALRALEGRWLSPDPVLLYVEVRGRGEDGPQIDLSALVAAERRAAEPPTAAEVQLAIEERLQPASLYRATWPVTPGETDFSGF